MTTLDEQIEELLLTDSDAARIIHRTAELVRAKVRDIRDGRVHEVFWTLVQGVGDWTCTCRPLPNTAEPCVHIALVARVTVLPLEGGESDAI
jgi:hypothetical protein